MAALALLPVLPRQQSTTPCSLEWFVSLAGLSHEQLLAVAQLSLKADRHGDARTHRAAPPDENARALQQVAAHQQHGLSYDAAIKATAQAELASPHTIRAAMEQFITTGTLTSPRSPVNRPAAHPLTPREGPSLAAEQLIHRELHEVTLNNVFQSCTTLRHELEEQLGVVVSKSTVHRWLHALGYVYGKKHFANQARSYRNAFIRSYTDKYAAALKEQEDGKGIIVYMDESCDSSSFASLSPPYLRFCLPRRLSYLLFLSLFPLPFSVAVPFAVHVLPFTRTCFAFAFGSPRHSSCRVCYPKVSACKQQRACCRGPPCACVLTPRSLLVSCVLPEAYTVRSFVRSLVRSLLSPIRELCPLSHSGFEWILIHAPVTAHVAAASRSVSVAQSTALAVAACRHGHAVSPGVG